MANLPSRIRRTVAALGMLTAFAAGCSADEVSGVDPATFESGTVTVDARTTWTYLDLAREARTVTPADPRTSGDWDMSFYATGVTLNGGVAGPGGVAGYCLCQNASATNEAILAMTPESERPDFDAVTAAQIPAANAGWATDTLIPAISGWYAGAGASATAAADRAWKLRLATDTAAYAKLRVVSLDGPTAQSPGRVTIEYAVQPTAASPLGEVVSRTVDARSGRAYVDLTSAAGGDETRWDLYVDGYTVRVNSGISGPGKAGAALATTPFAAITTAGDLRANVYRGDAFGGVFDGKRWYRYNLTGSNEISPTFDVYLLKRGSEVYKVQIIDYYSPTGEPRFITLRYAKIAG